MSSDKNQKLKPSGLFYFIIITIIILTIVAIIGLYFGVKGLFAGDFFTLIYIIPCVFMLVFDKKFFNRLAHDYKSGVFAKYFNKSKNN